MAYAISGEHRAPPRKLQWIPPALEAPRGESHPAHAVGVIPRLGSRAAVQSLQRSAGNRATARALAVQRQAAAVLLDPVPKIRVGRAVADDELVPLGEAPGRFAGFATRSTAAAVAGEAAEVTVVVRDPKEHFHVLRTDARSVPGNERVTGLPARWTLVEVVQPSAGKRPEPDVSNASQAPPSKQPDAYRRLLAAWTHVPEGEIAWAKGPENPPFKMPNDVTEGVVNVAKTLSARGRHAPSTLDPTANSHPQPTVCLAAHLFNQGPTMVRGTLLHESRHAYYARQAIDLIATWRRTPRRNVTRTSDWAAWLETQKKKLPHDVYVNVRAATVKEHQGSRIKEIYPHMEQFLYEFRRLNHAGADQATLRAGEMHALHAALADMLGAFAEDWGTQSGKKGIMTELLRSLQGFSANHRENLREFAAKKAGTYRPTDEFYKALARGLRK